MADERRQSAAPRICIVTPGQLGCNPRVVKEAQALHDAGFAVTVLATRMLDRIEVRDHSLMRRIPWRLERVDLSSRTRWRLLRVRQMAWRQAYAASGAARIADRGFSAFTAPLRRAALRTPADLYIAHYPAALPAAAAAAEAHGARYAYDAEDFHLGDLPDRPEHEPDRRLLRDIERRHLPGCAHVTAASPGIADAYARAYGIGRPAVLLNVFPLDQAPPRPTPKGTAAPGPSLYWFSQTVGPHRGLECAVRAIALARSTPHLYLRGTPVPGYVGVLERMAAECGAAGRVHVLPPEVPDRMERLAAAFDLGLCGEPGYTQNNSLALANKLFSYLLAGVPAPMSDVPAHRAFAQEAGLADLLYAADVPEALARVLDRLLADPSALAAARTRAWRLAREQYNWDRERSKLLETVARSLPPMPAQRVPAVAEPA